MDNKQKHLEFIQGAISRMASNLFFLRGWAITLITALFALSLKDANRSLVFVAYSPVIVFWILDGYFLSQERLFRSLYDYVRKLNGSKIDFSMDTNRFIKNKGNSWISAMFSNTLLFFYLPLIGVMLLITYLIK